LALAGRVTIMFATCQHLIRIRLAFECECKWFAFECRYLWFAFKCAENWTTAFECTQNYHLRM